MNKITATAARNNWFELIRKIIKCHDPIQITSKEGELVLMSQEDYESIVETVELMSVPDMLESIKEADRDIKKGKTYTMEDVFGD